MAKLMACRALDEEHMPIQAFQEAQNGFFFTNDGKTDVCYISPYMIATDGKDIIICQREDGFVEIGWKFSIERESSWWQWSKELGSFDTIVETAVKHSFISIWKNIETLDELPQDVKYEENKILKIGVKYKNLPQNSIKIHSTNRGTYDITKNFFFPIYFVLIPNNTTVNLTPLDDKLCTAVGFKWLAENTDNIGLSFEAKKIMNMIRAGDIVLPIIDNEND